MSGEINQQPLKSKLSKQGKTTLTGVFESKPTNTYSTIADYLTPNENPRAGQPIDYYIDNNALANTYLEHLKKERRI